jgi:SnoaL-like domain
VAIALLLPHDALTDFHGRLTEEASVSADQSLRDHNEIIAVTYRYALALDTRDWALLKDCFTPDAIADFGVWGKAVGVEQIIAAARPVMEGMDRTQHMIMNHLITLKGNEADCLCYLVAEHLLAAAAGGPTSTTRGLYRDRLVRTPAGWRIVARTLEVTWRDGNIGIFDEALRRSQPV